MNQAYSGCFTPILTRPKRIIVTAAACSKISYAHPSLAYGNFNYWYISGIRGKSLFGDAPLDADINNDGKVSTSEAYNFTLNKPGGASAAGPIPPVSTQMPQFEDNGTPPSRFGMLPAAGEGYIGMTDFL